jgi:hypothetical protein
MEALAVEAVVTQEPLEMVIRHWSHPLKAIMAVLHWLLIMVVLEAAVLVQQVQM